MQEQMNVQQLLTIKFNELKLRNPNFSVRSFARKLGMQPSATNEIMKGQRSVSKKLAEKIADKLDLDPSERTSFLKEFFDNKKLTTKKDRSITRLKSDQFELISNWIHFGILSLIKVNDFQSDIHWMADRLGVDSLDVRKALLRLQHLNLIQIAEDGQIIRTAHPIRTNDDILDLSLQEMHRQDMDIAKEKLKDVPVSLRDFTNFTFPANPETLPRAKEIIRNAQDELEQLMQVNPTEVYRVCMYLFPLTKTSNKKSGVIQ